MVIMFILLTLASIACVTDLRSRRIYNWTTYPGMIAGLALNGIGDLLADCGIDWWGRVIGGMGFVDALGGWLVCGLCMVICLVFFSVGAGDVKLIAMMGALLGLRDGVAAMLWTMVLGGGLAILLLIWQIGAVELLGRGLRQIGWVLRLGRQAALPTEDQVLLRQPMYLAPAALAAVLIVRFRLVNGM